MIKKNVCIDIISLIGDESSSKELSLYSLRLEESYNIFGCKYTLFGTVNYNLELDEGGHYITNLFPRYFIKFVFIVNHSILFNYIIYIVTLVNYKLNS